MGSECSVVSFEMVLLPLEQGNHQIWQHLLVVVDGPLVFAVVVVGVRRLTIVEMKAGERKKTL
jgi:hypothetical protein